MNGFLGSVLPTLKSLQAAAAHADRLDAERERTAARELPNCERRVVGCEVRYYDGPHKYAVVSQSMRVKWFETRPDGHDYPIR